MESRNEDGVEISSDGAWEAYDSNRDGYKLHVRKKDGTEDRMIVDDAVLSPCLAGDWVYYIKPLTEIDRVRLDGSRNEKVCGLDAMQGVSGSAAVTAEYKDGSILYKTVQLRSVGDDSSYPAFYYRLDLGGGKLTPVGN